MAGMTMLSMAVVNRRCGESSGSQNGRLGVGARQYTGKIGNASRNVQCEIENQMQRQQDGVFA